jgi:hypothetical protein
MTDVLKRLNEHTRGTFVRSAVQTTKTTDDIIDAIMPYFPSRCIVISGYVDDSDQYWKVNYHWDLLLYKVDEFLAMKDVQAGHLERARAIRATLMTSPPNPQRGYRTDLTMGATKDQSSSDAIVQRHSTLGQAKEDFKAVLIEANVIEQQGDGENVPDSEREWWLALAKVAAPGTSKHGKGYALDIQGDNGETKRIARQLNATLVFDEDSHVHVEWENGVVLPTV